MLVSEEEVKQLRKAFLKSLPAKLLVFGIPTIAAYFDGIDVPFAYMFYALLFVLAWEIMAYFLGIWLTAFAYLLGSAMVLNWIGHL